MWLFITILQGLSIALLLCALGYELDSWQLWTGLILGNVTIALIRDEKSKREL